MPENNLPTESPEANRLVCSSNLILKIYCSFSRLVPIASLRHHPLNPKRHPEGQIAMFKEVVKGNGIRRCITVSNLSGCIVAGHGLHQTLEALGATHAPVDFQDFEDEAHELAHLAADNKLAELGVVNEAQLDNIVKAMESNGLNRMVAGVLAEIAEDVVAAEKQKPIYELQPEFDEAYDAVIIFCRTGQQFAQLATILEIGKAMNRRGNIGTTHVIEAKKFFEVWKKSPSSSPATNVPAASQPTA